jgi:hypothetical protein
MRSARGSQPCSGRRTLGIRQWGRPERSGATSSPTIRRYEATANLTAVGTLIASLVGVAQSALGCAESPLVGSVYVSVKEDGIDPQFACGKFRWVLHAPVLYGGGFNCWPEVAPCETSFKRGILTDDCPSDQCQVVLEAIFRLSNEQGLNQNGVNWSGGGGMETPISASAERIGWLYYTPPEVGLAQFQRLRLRSEADVQLKVELNRGRYAPEQQGDRSSSGGGRAAIETLGEGFGVMLEHSIQEALSDPLEHRALAFQPGTTWATEMVSEQLSAGVSIGVENGLNASHTWSSGGDLAVQQITEQMVCKGWDCVGGDGPWNKVYAQDASVLAHAGLVNGLFARVHSKVILKTFEMSAMLDGDQCKECAAGPGYIDPSEHEEANP